jgi:hypothetical protein
MQIRTTCGVLLMLAVQGLAIPSFARASAPSRDPVHQNAIQEVPDYKGFLATVFGIYAKSIEAQVAVPGSESSVSIEFADDALRLWQATGDESYYKVALQPYRNFIAQPDLQKQFDVFRSYPLAHATLLLQQAKRLPPGDLATVREAFLDQQKKGYPFRFGNRELGVMSGACLAAFQLFPNDPAFAPTREKFESWWARQDAIGDLNENSGNYSSLGLTELIKIVRAMGREDDLKNSARWQNTFARYRAMVSPGGQLPEFGDDYFEEGGKIPFYFLFEYAAQLYNDPTYAYAARKLYLRRLKYMPEPHGAHGDLHNLSAAFMGNDLLELKLSTRTPVPGPLVTGITHRYDEFGIERDDKLFLRPSLEPGAPELMMELYPWGDHSHQENRGSITYLEDANVPLFRGGYGRYWGRQTGDGGNAFYLQPDGESFPLDRWKSGSWKTVRLEASRLPLPGDATDQSRRLYTGLIATGACHLGVPGKEGCFVEKNAGTGDSAITIDNIRLEGPAGVKILEDFEGPNPPAGAELTQDASHGAQAITIRPSSKRVAIVPPGNGVEFSLNDYKVLAYDIKQTGKPQQLTTDFRIPDAPNGSHTYDAWHTVAPGPFYAALASARTEVHGKDSYAEVRYDGYGTWDSTLTRRIVLTKEGVIVIRDTFTAGATAAGWTPGAVWQLPAVAAHAGSWFASTLMEDVSPLPQDHAVYRRGMLVYFSAPAALQCGSIQQSYAAHLSRTIAWAKMKPLAAGSTISLVTIVVPTDETTDTKQLGDAISSTDSVAGTQVRVPLHGLQVDISQHGWDVRREAASAASTEP